MLHSHKFGSGKYGRTIGDFWRPGDPVIVPPAGSCGVASDRMAGAEDGVNCEDWFFCTKQLAADEVEAKIRAQ